MRTEFVYSIIALGAIPVVANAADAKQIDAIVSVDGAKQTINVGKLVKGNYTFNAQLTSKVYGVTVKIAGKTENVISDPANPTAVSIDFTLDKETDVELEVVSTDPGEPGAGFQVADAMVVLDFNFTLAKSALVANANALKTTNIPAYPYTSTADETAVDNLVAKINAIAETYEAYVAQKLYQDASVPQGEIDALAATIADHQNTQAYNDVNALITAIKAKYNDAVADIKASLVNEAAYLLPDALADLNTNINEKITAATTASYASYTGKTAVADKVTNVGMIPTEGELNDIVNDWKGQGTANQTAYNTLHAKVTALQGQLDAIAPVESIASLFPKTEAQAAIDAVNADVEAAKNSAAQLTLDVTAKETAAQNKINTLAGKVNTANAEYNANVMTGQAITALQESLNAGKTTVNALKSADGKYEAKNYYDAYVQGIQDAINQLTTGANNAYKPDGTGSAVAYHNALNTTDIQDAIDLYAGTTEPAVDGMPKQAVDKYNALQTAIAKYQGELDAARAQVEGLAVYTAEGYDYQLQFDLLQKRINDIKKAITAAQGKVGAEHWTEMLAIDSHAEISNDIATLLSSVQADQNQYDADHLADGMTTLKGKITAFQAKDATVLGADVATFQNVEDGINAAYTAVKTAKDAINPSSETVDYTAKVSTDKSAWSVGSGNGSNKGTYSKGGITLIEHYGESGVGNMIWQDVSVENGIYEVQVYATSHNAWNNYGATLQEDADDVAYVFANDNKKFITARRNSGMLDSEPEVYTISDVVVTNGKLKIGLSLAKAAQTEWHTIQIKSLKANTASLIQGWGKKVDDLNDEQTTLETAANAVAAKVAATKAAQTTLATSIGDNEANPKTGMWKSIDDFKTFYKIGTAESTLGNAGKPGGEVAEAVATLETDLTALQTANTAVDPTVATDTPKTDKVGTKKADWKSPLSYGDGENYAENNGTVESYKKSCDYKGVVLNQTVTGLDNGIYTVVLTANANYTPGRGFDSDLVDGANTAAYVFANGATAPVVSHVNTGWTLQDIAIENVIVSDGTLELGLAKNTAQTNWHAIQIKSLTYRENSQDALYNNTDAENPGLNNRYTKLNTTLNGLKDAAPGIKEAVEHNAASNTAAQTAMTNLGTYEDNLKNLKDVSGADGNYSTSVAKKADPSNWAVFRSGLANDKNYQAKKDAIDATIAAMTAAITDANAAETLPYPWAGEITITTPDDPATTEVDESSSTTYKISDIQAAIDALKAEAAAESDNYWAYRNVNKPYNLNMVEEPAGSGNKVNKGTLFVAINEAKDGLDEIAGDGAKQYYNDLVASYEGQRDDIVTRMVASLNARTAVADKDGYDNELKDLQNNKVKKVKEQAAANLAKYNEQKQAAADVQTLWNSTYTEIAATDHSSKRDEWLNALDAIQVTLTAATNAVETNYPKGESVAKAQDFAAIQTAINDVKAQQQEAYVAQIAEDNKIAHESFMGTDTKKGAIQLATEAYQRAVAERAQYSSTNEQIKAAVDAAAATLDAALYSCPTDIATLTKAENDAYTAVVSPTVFDVSQYNQQANDITQGITLELAQFKEAVKTAINNDVWTPKKTEYNGKLTTAKNDIASYSDGAKADAFKDVEDLIAKGDAGVASITLSEVEAAIAGLEDIDDMLAADKDAAADKDITTALSNADHKYAEVETYINGVSDEIAAKNQQLQILVGAYSTVQADKELPKNFANHDQIVGDANNFITTATNCKTAVENAVAADKANTDAYNEIIAAIAPLEAKLVEAEEAAAPYKYQTSFENEENLIEQGKSLAKEYLEAGTAVAHKDAMLANIAAHANDIEATLTTAFGNEKAGLASTDIPELKNQFNAYVAAKGLDETALKFQTDINNLETALTNAAIVEVDDPADGIKFNDILDATAKLIKLQNDIADKESELLEANASTANAEVLADFNNQIGEMEQTASLEGYAEWVAVQPYGDTTLGAAIESLKTQIADVKTAVNAEPNIAFYKDQYQASIDKIKADLVPVAAAIAAKQAQYDTNAAAYTRLTNEVNALQERITLAKDKVEKGYIYAPFTYQSYIEQYGNPDDPTELTGGVQKTLNDAKGLIDNWYGEKFLTEESEVPNKNLIETRVQLYLDRSANRELIGQRDHLYIELANALQYQAQTYSPVLWQRLIDKQGAINLEINALSDAIDYSYATYVYDEEQQAYVPKTRTSDADYAEQKAEVDRIQGEIDDLHEVFENLDILGDANVDGRVNVLDYQTVVNMILDPTLQPAEDTDLFANIDINQSEVIEVGDLTAIVNYILNQDWQGNAAARSFNRGDNENLSLNYSSVNSDVQRIAVNLENANNYTAFQMDVVLPDGMKIVGTSLSSRAGQSHKLYSRTQLDGSVRILASSISGETFSGNEGAVLYIDVEGAKASSVEILNILFSDVNANTRAFKLGNNVTGIDAIGSTFDALKQKVYDLGGRVMNGVKKGINIIRNADGSTRKVAE